MRSELRGAHTSDVEVTNVSPHGFWLLVDDRELFVPFKTFPWFEACHDPGTRPGGTTERPSLVLAGTRRRSRRRLARASRALSAREPSTASRETSQTIVTTTREASRLTASMDGR